MAHLDVIFDTLIVCGDDQLVVRDRKLLLLEDEKMKEAARKYGDRKRILAQNALTW